MTHKGREIANYLFFSSKYFDKIASVKKNRRNVFAVLFCTGQSTKKKDSLKDLTFEKFKRNKKTDGIVQKNSIGESQLELLITGPSVLY